MKGPLKGSTLFTVNLYSAALFFISFILIEHEKLELAVFMYSFSLVVLEL